ncbi:hypothetical protein [Arthrobacter sp. NPDC090010]|uniref:hypothetical protein n=1 Tax=Arthrobacter sp. NPDC090010 TaxID=3363942 RepID=UPI0038008D80
MELLAALQERGLQVSHSTLSSWRTGRRRPDAFRSLQTLSALEEVLGLEAGALTAHIVGRSPRIGSVPRQADVDPVDAELLAALPASPLENIRLLSLREEIFVDEALCISRIDTMVVLQCVKDGLDSFAVTRRSPHAADSSPVIEVHYGGSLLASHRHSGRLGTGYAIELSRRLSVGQTAVVALRTIFPADYPAQRSHVTRAWSSIRELVNVFHFANAPEWIEEVERSGSRARSRDSSPGPAGSLLQMKSKFGPGTISTRWGRLDD